QFIRVGEHSFVAGASLVRKNVPPYVKAAREPISYIGVNSIGLKRRAFEDEVIRNIENIYREIYVLNSNISKALSIVEEEYAETPERTKILNFIRQSEKGIMRGNKG
ncbi:MAG: acyl-[acyl-carrier-protein]--UDP-N-acetylglucosamine O-acyltransferase, partial [Flavobacteriales bacterium]|nr:acyl-[acyl-carrier-protein]--UDP-N-acetylglucosamine O-acyltransferase [Flavobacteriales bacterium]